MNYCAGVSNSVKSWLGRCRAGRCWRSALDSYGWAIKGEVPVEEVLEVYAEFLPGLVEPRAVEVDVEDLALGVCEGDEQRLFLHSNQLLYLYVPEQQVAFVPREQAVVPRHRAHQRERHDKAVGGEGGWRERLEREQPDAFALCSDD